jgi:predicted porin
MKKVLLAGTALVGAALIASPAQAELKLGLGGHFSGYAVYHDQDNDTNQHNFEFRRNTEIHFTGETMLDNGLTVGFHTEMEVEGNDLNNESYAYFSGGWGRVNFGNEDGAAYLLQVAAPSADSNVDGLRTTISSLNAAGNFIAGGTAIGAPLDYQHADFGTRPSQNVVDPVTGDVVSESFGTDRLTYLTPKFNGFQAGVSYAPTAGRATGIAAMGADNDADDFKNLWEAAARWDGQFEGVGLSLGAGYSHASAEDSGSNDSLKTWNVGTNLAWNQFSVGAAYLKSNNGISGPDGDSRTWVVGAAWDNGPWHAGVSYLDRKDDTNVFGTAGDLDSERWTLGGGYAFGPGMTFRGSLSFGEISETGNSEDFTMVAIGTDIRF